MASQKYIQTRDDKDASKSTFSYSDDSHNDAAVQPSYKVARYNGYAHRSGTIEITEVPGRYNTGAAGATEKFTLKFNHESGNIVEEVPPQITKVTSVIAHNEPGHIQMNEPMAGVVFHELARETLSDIAGKGDTQFRMSDFQKIAHDYGIYAMPANIQALNLKTDDQSKVIKTIESHVDSGTVTHEQARNYFAFEACEAMKTALFSLTVQDVFHNNVVYDKYNTSKNPAYEKSQGAIALAHVYLDKALEHNETSSPNANSFATAVDRIKEKADLADDCIDRAVLCFDHKYHDKAQELAAAGQGAHAKGTARDAKLRAGIEKYVEQNGIPASVDDLVTFAKQVPSLSR